MVVWAQVCVRVAPLKVSIPQTVSRNSAQVQVMKWPCSGRSVLRSRARLSGFLVLVGDPVPAN